MSERPTMPTDQDIDALYRSATDAEPTPALDARVLAAAHAAQAAAGANAATTQPRAAKPWWQRWLPVSGAIAASLLGVSLTLRLLDDERRTQAAYELETRAGTADAAPAAEATPAAVGEAATATAAAKASRPAPAISIAPAASAARAVAAPDAVPPAPSFAAGVQAPATAAPAAPAAASSGHLDGLPAEALGYARDAAASAGAGNEAAGLAPLASPAAARSGAQLKRHERARDSAAEPMAKSANGNLPAPADWLTRIRELLAEGKATEARQALAQFRRAYPMHPLPDDLKFLAPAPVE